MVIKGHTVVVTTRVLETRRLRDVAQTDCTLYAFPILALVSSVRTTIVSTIESA